MVSERSLLRFMDLDVCLAFSVSFKVFSVKFLSCEA